MKERSRIFSQIPLLLAAGLFVLSHLIPVSYGVAEDTPSTGMPASTPAIFWASVPIHPGEATVLAGGNFVKYMDVRIGRVPDTEVMDPPSSSPYPASLGLMSLPSYQPAEQSVKFIVPSSLKMGLFLCRIANESGAAATIMLNRPDPWWLQGDGGAITTPGGFVRVMGRSLAFPDAKSVILLEGPDGKLRRLPPSEATTWSLTVPLPANLAEGSYRLRVHNGFGGKFGWSDPLSLSVRKRAAWKADVFDAVEQGADPTGKKDSTTAVKKALSQAAENGGGVVFFPRGRYMISDALVVPRFTVLRGEGVELSCLFWRPGRDERITALPPAALIQGTNSFGMEDMAVYSQYYQHVIVGDLGDKAEAGDIFLRRVRVRANLYTGHLKPEEVDRRFREALKLSSGGGDTVRLGGRNIEMTDCDFYGAGRAIFLSRVRDGIVARNTFYNGRWGWYSISGSDRLIFEKNKIIGADLMSTGGGLSPDGSGYSQNIYYAFNKLELMHGWDREAMTSDGGGSAYSGRIEWAEGRRVSLAGSPKWGGNDRRGMGVFILDGRGKGQFRILSSYDGTIIEVDQPWIIQPDASSHISITMLQRNYLIIGNEFRDATGAVQFYGTSIGHVVAENKSWRAGGFHNIGMNYAGGWQPSWFVQFLHNEIVEGNQGFNGPMNEFPPLESHVAALGSAYSPTEAAMNRFTVIRGNRLRNNARIEIGGACEDVVIDDNLVENADVGVTVGGPGSHHGGNPVGVLLHGNQFEKVNVPLSDYTGKALTVPVN
jgi:hypothetical protein